MIKRVSSNVSNSFCHFFEGTKTNLKVYLVQAFLSCLFFYLETFSHGIIGYPTQWMQRALHKINRSENKSYSDSYDAQSNIKNLVLRIQCKTQIRNGFSWIRNMRKRCKLPEGISWEKERKNSEIPLKNYRGTAFTELNSIKRVLNWKGMPRHHATFYLQNTR